MLGTLKRLITKPFRRNKKITIPLVRLQGVIQAGGSQFRPALNLAGVEELLEKAFDFKKAPAVAIAINSPGGSPVQSRAIFHKIRALAKEKEKKVLVFVEDVAASGGFGFPELIKKLGVERRVYTAGENKSVLDPFLPEKQSDIDHLKSLQLDVHRVFIDMVKERRAGKLADSEQLFSGLFWSGEKGKELGLVDGIGDMTTELKLRYGDKLEVETIEASRGFVGRFISGRHGGLDPQAAIGAGVAGGAIEMAEERLWWSRYGL